MPAPTQNLVTRLTVDGGAEIVSVARAAGAAFVEGGVKSEAALNKSVKTAEQLEATYKRLAAAAKARGDADERNANIGTASGVHDPWLGSAEQSAAIFEQFDRQIQAAHNLRMEIDPAYAAQSRFNDKVNELLRIYDGLTGKEDEFVTQIDRATAAYNQQLAVIEKANAAAEQGAATPLQGHIANLTGISATENASEVQARAYVADYNRLLEEQDRQVHALKVALDPMVAAQDRYNKAVEQANALKPHIGVELYDKAILKAKTDLDAFERSQLSNRGAQLSAGQLQNLSFQLNDVVTGLMSGQHAEQIFAQQGGQIFQALQMGEGGVAGGLKAVLGMLNPYVIGIVAATGAMALGTAAAISYANAQDQLALSLMGAGRASGLTAGQLEDMAVKQAAAGNISVADARAQEAAYLRLGITSKKVLEAMIADTRNYALVTGTDAKTANEALGRAMAQPTTAGVEMLRGLGLLDDKVKEHIDHLVRLGEIEDAQSYILDTMQPHIAAAADHVNILAQAWHQVQLMASGAFEAMGHQIDSKLAPSPQDILDRWNAGDRQTGLGLATGIGGMFGTGVTEEDKDRASREIAAQIATAMDAKSDAKLKPIKDAASAGLGVLAPSLNQRKALDDDLAAVKTGFENHTVTAEQWAAAQKGHDNQVTALDRKDNPAVPGAAHFAELQRQAEAMDVNIKQSLELADAYLKSSAAGMQAEATRKGMTDATRKGTDADAAVERQLKLTVATQEVASAKAVADMRDQTASQTSVNNAVLAGLIPARHMQDAMQLEALQRPVLTALTIADGAEKVRLTGILNDLTEAYHRNTNAQDVASMLGVNDALKDRNDLMAVQLGLIGATNLQRDVAMAAAQAKQDNADLDMNDPHAVGQAMLHSARLISGAKDQNALDVGTNMENLRKDQADAMEMARKEMELVGAGNDLRTRSLAQLALKQQLIRQGVDLTTAEGKALLDNNNAIMLMNQQLERQNGIHSDIADLQKTEIERVNDLILSGSTQWKDWKSAALDALGDVIAKADKLMILNPLENWLFGTHEQTMKDAGGAINFLSSLFSSSGGGGGSSPESGLAHESVHAHAMGTNYAPGGWSQLAENGFEIVTDPTVRNLRRGSRVMNNHDSVNFLRRLSGNNRAPSGVIGAAIIKLDLGNAVGPLADFINSIEGKLNEGLARTRAEAADDSRRSLAGHLDAIDEFGQA